MCRELGSSFPINTTVPVPLASIPFILMPFPMVFMLAPRLSYEEIARVVTRVDDAVESYVTLMDKGHAFESAIWVVARRFDDIVRSFSFSFCFYPLDLQRPLVDLCWSVRVANGAPLVARPPLPYSRLSLCRALSDPRGSPSARVPGAQYPGGAILHLARDYPARAAVRLCLSSPFPRLVVLCTSLIPSRPSSDVSFRGSFSFARVLFRSLFDRFCRKSYPYLDRSPRVYLDA